MKKHPGSPSPFDPNQQSQGDGQQPMRKLQPPQEPGNEHPPIQVQRVSSTPSPGPLPPGMSNTHQPLESQNPNPVSPAQPQAPITPSRVAPTANRIPAPNSGVPPMDQRPGTPAPMQQPLSPSGRAAVQTQSKKKRHRKFGWLDALLLALGILLLCMGLYFLLRPHFIAKNQKAVSSALFEMAPIGKDFDAQSEEGIYVDPEANKVNGEAWESFSGEGITYDKNQKVLIKPIARLQIDSIDLNLPILDNAGLVDLRYGIGYYRSSASLFSDTGLSVLFGHHMYERGHYFNRLNEVRSGDTVRVTGNKKVYTYTVDKTILVTAEEMLSLLNQTTSEKYLLMITCESGLNTNDKRILVYAKLTKVEDMPQS